MLYPNPRPGPGHRSSGTGYRLPLLYEKTLPSWVQYGLREGCGGHSPLVPALTQRSYSPGRKKMKFQKAAPVRKRGRERHTQSLRKKSPLPIGSWSEVRERLLEGSSNKRIQLSTPIGDITCRGDLLLGGQSSDSQCPRQWPEHSLCHLIS